MNREFKKFVLEGDSHFLPHVSVDCVVFGFHENKLKVLLLKMKGENTWSLAGGFIRRDEPVELAAHRVLNERTGLDDIYLQQFHLFGNTGRQNVNQMQKWFKATGITIPAENWLLQRFVSLGYYALVEYSRVDPKPDPQSECCAWFGMHELPDLVMDHLEILESALKTVRSQLSYVPVGLSLLPQKFSMPELQKLYETILGRKLDRRNFQRRILGYGILKKLKERRKGGAHKAPYLYTFNQKKYHKALQDGLEGGW